MKRSAVRTPVGKFGSSLRSHLAVEFGAAAIREAIARASIAAAQVEHVVMGHVLQAGGGQVTSRQAAISAGVPQQVPAMTLNNVCLSSLTAIAYADQLVRLGELDTVVAGGWNRCPMRPT